MTRYSIPNFVNGPVCILEADMGGCSDENIYNYYFGCAG